MGRETAKAFAISVCDIVPSRNPLLGREYLTDWRRGRLDSRPRSQATAQNTNGPQGCYVDGFGKLGNPKRPTRAVEFPNRT